MVTGMEVFKGRRDWRRTAAFGAIALLASGLAAGAAMAAQPVPGGLGLQEAASEIKSDIEWMHNYLLVWITAITVFVLGLLGYCIVRFNAKANPVPSKTSHNTMIEVVWTLVPCLILIAIAVPSIRLLYKEAEIPPADLVIKATGHQWYWSYEYTDHEGLAFDSIMLSDEDAKKAGEPRLLAVDNKVVVPEGAVVKLLLTGADVIHAWAMPAFGVKMDAMPGRINETWFKAEKTGVYYGQCSELCGKDHAYMPIAVEVKSKADYALWLGQAKQKFAGAQAPTQMAAANVAPTQN
jgi:cytochrome c oxidase subunit II